MHDYERFVREYFDATGITYSSRDGYLQIIVTTKDLGDFPINLSFYDDLPIYRAVTWGHQDLCFKGREGIGLIACNYVNKRCGGCAFYLDDDGDVACGTEAFTPNMSMSDCGKVCYYLIGQIRDTFNSAYSIFKKALSD